MKKETADMKLWLRISDYNWDLDVRLGKRFGPRDIPLWKLALLQEASIGRVADAADLYPGLELPSKPALVEPQGWEYHDLRIASRLEALFTAADAEAQAEAQVQFADSEGGVVGGAGGGGGMGAATLIQLRSPKGRLPSTGRAARRSPISGDVQWFRRACLRQKRAV